MPRKGPATRREIVADPMEKMRGLSVKPHPRIPVPPDIYQPERRNARGMDLSDEEELLALLLLLPWIMTTVLDFARGLFENLGRFAGFEV